MNTRRIFLFFFSAAFSRRTSQTDHSFSFQILSIVMIQITWGYIDLYMNNIRHWWRQWFLKISQTHWPIATWALYLRLCEHAVHLGKRVIVERWYLIQDWGSYVAYSCYNFSLWSLYISWTKYSLNGNMCSSWMCYSQSDPSAQPNAVDSVISCQPQLNGQPTSWTYSHDSFIPLRHVMSQLQDSVWQIITGSNHLEQLIYLELASVRKQQMNLKSLTISDS